MELWDLYDDDGNRTGKTIEREKSSFGNSENHLVVHIYIRNNNGEFLIQKRSMKKKMMPGIWDITGGAVVYGENSIDGAIREVEEEIGILLKSDDLKLITRFHRPHCFIDIWDVKKDIDLSRCILQENEVDEVKYVQKEELFDMFKNGPYFDDGYNKIIYEYYQK